MKQIALTAAVALLLAGGIACKAAPALSSPETSGSASISGDQIADSDLHGTFDAPLSTQALAARVAVSAPLLAALNGETLYCPQSKQWVSLRDFSVQPVPVSLVDLDGDGNCELILELPETCLVLRDLQGLVYLYQLGIRSLYYPQTNGVFTWNGSAGQAYGSAKLAFDGTDCRYVELTRVEESGASATYYIDGRETTEADFRAYTDSIEAPRAERYWWQPAEYPDGK